MGDIIENYISTYPFDIETKKMYRNEIKRYFSVIRKKPNTYFKEKRDFRSDILKYCKSQQHQSAKTFGRKVSIIRGFYKHYEIPFPDNAVKTFRNASKTLRGNRPITQDSIPTKEELEKILTHGGVGEKALFTTLISSGMRVGEAIQLTFEDIEFDKNPVLVDIKGVYTKGGFSRIAFISEEATKFLKEWLKVRENYIEKYRMPTKNLTGKEKKTEDNRLFPINEKTAWRWFRNMLISSGYTQKARGNSNRFAFHIHSLRKYFRTNMPTGGMSIDMVETLMGHSGYLTAEYRGYNEKQLGEEYKNSQHSVTIFGSGISPKSFQEVKSEIDVIRKDRDIKYKEHFAEIQKIREEMEERFRIEREYSIIINQILTGKIKVSSYEMKIVKEFGLEGLPHSEKELDYMIRNNAEFSDFCEVIEKIKAEKRKTIF